MIFCNICGKEFEPIKGWERKCPVCEASKGWNGKKHCMKCGKEFINITKTRKNGISYTKREGSVCCAICRPYKQIAPSFKNCPVCGLQFLRKQGKIYCSLECRNAAKQPDAKYSPAHNAAAIRWQQKNPDIARIQGIARKLPGALTILYECPCDHDRKHNHHPDYSKPFEVIKLCPACHAAEHKRLRNLLVQAQAI